jgi:glycosyltransferase involved in cell wall biosynthesis
MKMSVVILFYHNIDVMGYDNLKVLKTTLPFWSKVKGEFEVIVVDDGSNRDCGAKEFVESLGYKYTYNDSGEKFSAASASNLGILVSTGNRLLFTDCGIIPDQNIIIDHIENATPTNITVGSICRINRYMVVSTNDYNTGEYIDEYNKLISNDIYKTDRLISHNSIMSVLSDGYILNKWDDVILDNNMIIVPGELYCIIHIEPDVRWNTQTCNLWDFVWGYNMCFNKGDLLEVNGFDEDYDGEWGATDRDIGYRLVKKGLDVKLLTNAIGYHIDHPVHRTSITSIWVKKFDSKMNSDIKRQLPKSWGYANE